MKDLRRLADKLNVRMVGAMALGLTAFATAANAQDKVETTIAADVVSQYYWRGQELGAISLQPTLGHWLQGILADSLG